MSCDVAGKAAEVAGRFHGWRVWVSNSGSPVATRTGSQHAPADDDVWARTVIGDNWPDLENQLAEQAARDAEAGRAVTDAP